MCDGSRKGIYKLKDVKDDMLADAIETAFDFSKKVIILERIVAVLCVIIACLIAGYFII